jgi:preprotein translocase subunit SecE
MNRQMKRAQERAERAQKRAGTDRKAAPASTARSAQQRETRKRTGAREFLRQVRAELKKVDWPTREELLSYTVVVLVTVTVLTTFVFGLDYLFTKLIFNLFS